MANFQAHVKDSFEDELADALIRILDMCGGLGIDIQRHVEEKLHYNATRERLYGKNY
jgi:NTP pyrophosphatase (non-canonical NTP hydrolase)